MSKEGFSISLASPHAPGLDGVQKLGIALFALAFLFTLVGMFGPAAKDPALFFYLGFVGSAAGLSVYMVRSILNKPAGVQTITFSHQVLPIVGCGVGPLVFFLQGFTWCFIGVLTISGMTRQLSYYLTQLVGGCSIMHQTGGSYIRLCILFPS